MMANILFSATILASCMLLLWLYSITVNRVSFIDAFWGTGFIVVAAAIVPADIGTAQSATILLLTLWGLRLSLYLLGRYRAHGEDARYIKILDEKKGISRHFFSVWFVFGLQGLLILIIASPIISILSKPPENLTILGYLGIFVWAIGAFFEWGGDWQLSRFKANPENEGKVLDTGLWAWTRHPNYFGDACVWWGLWLIGHDISTIFSPIIMTLLLMKWSGVPLLEKSLKKRRPDYEGYMARTSAFFPQPPKK